MVIGSCLHTRHDENLSVRPTGHTTCSHLGCSQFEAHTLIAPTHTPNCRNRGHLRGQVARSKLPDGRRHSAEHRSGRRRARWRPCAGGGPRHRQPDKAPAGARRASDGSREGRYAVCTPGRGICTGVYGSGCGCQSFWLPGILGTQGQNSGPKAARAFG
eukprot:363419-Chlamydomonas_euryale.AAC.10